MTVWSTAVPRPAEHLEPLSPAGLPQQVTGAPAAATSAATQQRLQQHPPHEQTPLHSTAHTPPHTGRASQPERPGHRDLRSQERKGRAPDLADQSPEVPYSCTPYGESLLCSCTLTCAAAGSSRGCRRCWECTRGGSTPRPGRHGARPRPAGRATRGRAAPFGRRTPGARRCECLTTWTIFPKMAVITSDCGATRSLSIEWP